MIPGRVDLLLERLDSPLGQVLVVTEAAAPGRIRALDWHDHEDRLHRLLRIQFKNETASITSATHPLASRLSGSAPTASPAARALGAYFDGDPDALETLPIHLGGTPFQRAVWMALRGIPAGTTLTYAELARQIGQPRAVRAVGAANGANPLSLILPCHRVVGSDQSLRGYAGGLARKQWLLEHERRHAGLRPASTGRCRRQAQPAG